MEQFTQIRVSFYQKSLLKNNRLSCQEINLQILSLRPKDFRLDRSVFQMNHSTSRTSSCRLFSHFLLRQQLQLNLVLSGSTSWSIHNVGSSYHCLQFLKPSKKLIK